MQKKIKWPLVGNNHVTRYLEKILWSESAGGAYVFNGPDNLGKTTTALHFARLLSCRKPAKYDCENCSMCQNVVIDEETDDESDVLASDLYFVKKSKDKKNISIEQIRTLIKALSLSSFSGGYKLGIIKHADGMSEEASNALLKTLEEPKKKVLIILITNNLNRLLKTIISRSQIINFRPVNTDVIYDSLLTANGVNRTEARSVARRSSGRPALAAKFAEDREFSDLYKKRVRSFVEIFFSIDISRRLSALDGLTEKSWTNQETVSAVRRIFDIWLSAARDILNYDLNVKYLIQNEELERECDSTVRSFGMSEIVALIKLIEKSKILLHQNVNPKLVLENVVINF